MAADFAANHQVNLRNRTLEFTGERFVPGAPGEIWYEHWHRYHFAAPLAAGREALDVACGEGYGSALLARRAARVVGVDRSREAIDHARVAYAPAANLAFLQADCAALPFGAASFDAVVSFETIEHIRAQEAFLDEVARVLRPEGLLVLSSPNKLEYSERRGCTNPYHVHELYREELAAIVAARFEHALWFGQRMSFFSVVWPEQGGAQGELFEVSETAGAETSHGHARPLYFIVVASRSAEAIAGVVPRLSVLADRDEWVTRNYAKAWSDLAIQWERGNKLDGVVAEWQEHHRAAVRHRDELLEAIAERDAARAQERAVFEREIARREGLRWCLGYPVRWLRARARWLRTRSRASL